MTWNDYLELMVPQADRRAESKRYADWLNDQGHMARFMDGKLPPWADAKKLRLARKGQEARAKAAACLEAVKSLPKGWTAVGTDVWGPSCGLTEVAGDLEVALKGDRHRDDTFQVDIPLVAIRVATLLSANRDYLAEGVQVKTLWPDPERNQIDPQNRRWGVLGVITDEVPKHSHHAESFKVMHDGGSSAWYARTELEGQYPEDEDEDDLGTDPISAE